MKILLVLLFVITLLSVVAFSFKKLIVFVENYNGKEEEVPLKEKIRRIFINLYVKVVTINLSLYISNKKKETKEMLVSLKDKLIEIKNSVLKFVKEFKTREKTTFKQKVNTFFGFVYEKFLRESIMNLSIVKDNDLNKVKDIDGKYAKFKKLLEIQKDSKMDEFKDNNKKLILLIVLHLFFFILLAFIESFAQFINVNFFLNLTFGTVGNFSILYFILVIVAGMVFEPLKYVGKLTIIFGIIDCYYNLVVLLSVLSFKLKIDVLLVYLKIDVVLLYAFNFLVKVKDLIIIMVFLTYVNYLYVKEFKLKK